jgi:protein-S-isoprenylcysteine O-methyltransferase Ste14
MDRDRIFKTLHRWRVRAGLVFLPALLVFARPRPLPAAAGLAVCVLGLAVRAWAAGHIKKEKQLAVSGPYRYTRNPLYLGNFLLGLGVGIGTGTWIGLLIFAVYFLAFYPPVILEERDRMRRIFPEAYADYEAKVPIFLPALRPYPAAPGAKFSVAQYRRNREQRALIGTAVIWAILAARMILGF